MRNLILKIKQRIAERRAWAGPVWDPEMVAEHDKRVAQEFGWDRPKPGPGINRRRLGTVPKDKGRVR
jgi:hypothetical protein